MLLNCDVSVGWSLIMRFVSKANKVGKLDIKGCLIPTFPGVAIQLSPFSPSKPQAAIPGRSSRDT